MRKPGIPRILGALLLPLGILLGHPASAAAQGRSLVIERFDAAIDVLKSGDVMVEEVIRPRFTGQWNGIYRTIPVIYRTPQGFGYRLDLEVLGVTDGDGRELRVERSYERHYLQLKIWIPGAVDATRTVRIRYRVSNALKFFEEHDELYWNVTGDEWDVPIERVEATVVLPEGVTGLRGTAFTGGYGSTEQAATMEELGAGYIFRMDRSLSFGEGLTIAVAWDPGVVERPSFLDRVARFLRANWLFAIPILAWGVLLWLWHTRGRDPAKRAIVPQYRPPEGLTPAEVGTLVDNSPDSRDILATLVDLAVRGYLKIEEQEKKGFLGFGGGSSYILHLKKGPGEWDDLQDHERRMLSGIFSGGSDTVVPLDDLENEFYREVPKIKDGIFRRLKGLGYYRQRPDRVRGAYMGAGAVVLAVFMALGIVLLNGTVVAPTTVIVSAVLTAAAFFVVGFFMPARTVRGARAQEEVLGFQEFLDRVEEDRFKRMITSVEMFEKYLPFAMALGVEKRWAKAFDDLLTEPPDWYVGYHGGPFRPTLFVGNVSHMGTAATTAMTSQPRSSGGSGFGGGGGGGFSGGGFGGGGGGGF